MLAAMLPKTQPRPVRASHRQCAPSSFPFLEGYTEYWPAFKHLLDRKEENGMSPPSVIVLLFLND